MVIDDNQVIVSDYTLGGSKKSAYETYHTRILFFERYVRTLTYSILAYAYPRAVPESDGDFEIQLT